MNLRKLARATTFVLFAVVAASAQRGALPPQVSHESTELRPTHPAEPVKPVPAGTYPGPLTIPINSSTWTAFGPAPILNGQRPGGGPVSGRLTGIAADPVDHNTIYVAAACGGVWKTTNGGRTWASLTESQ